MAITTSTLPEPATGDAAARQWDEAAAGWSRHGGLIRNWLRPATDAMLHMARLQPGMQVLDVAAGAGDQTLDIAEQVGAEGSVMAVDRSPAILRLALEHARRAHHAQVACRVADGQSLPFAEASFDAVVCRLGLMFFPQPEQGVREMARVLRPGGWAVAMVFSRPERNPCITTLMGTALRHAGLPPRDPFLPGGLLSLGRPGLAETLFRQAGLHDVATVALDAPFDLPSVDDYVAFVRDAAGPVRELLAALDAPAAQAAWADITARLRAFDGADGWHGPNELLLTAGRR